MSTRIKYIWERSTWKEAAWPRFTWDPVQLVPVLSRVRLKQGRLLGRMDALALDMRRTSQLRIGTEETLHTSGIEGENLNRNEVRSSVARRLGVDAGGLTGSSRKVDGLVDMLFDATSNYSTPVTAQRLFEWQRMLFPDAPRERGAYRTDTRGPMQVVSGPMGRETVHFEAPPARDVAHEMERFLVWLENAATHEDPVIKAAHAHLAFLTIHPFEDGNGRMARALTDLMLARSEESPARYYSMSDRIVASRAAYYRVLESTQKGTMDVTEWTVWFLGMMEAAIDHSQELLAGVLARDRFWRTVSKETLNERHILVLERMLDDDYDGDIRSSKWARMTGVSRDTAVRDIQELVEAGILIQNPGKGRSTSYRLTLGAG